MNVKIRAWILSRRTICRVTKRQSTQPMSGAKKRGFYQKIRYEARGDTARKRNDFG
jgi:hypothetical protein